MPGRFFRPDMVNTLLEGEARVSILDAGALLQTSVFWWWSRHEKRLQSSMPALLQTGEITPIDFATQWQFQSRCRGFFRRQSNFFD